MSRSHFDAIRKKQEEYLLLEELLHDSETPVAALLRRIRKRRDK